MAQQLLRDTNFRLFCKFNIIVKKILIKYYDRSNGDISTWGWRYLYSTIFINPSHFQKLIVISSHNRKFRYL